MGCLCDKSSQYDNLEEPLISGDAVKSMEGHGHGEDVNSLLNASPAKKGEEVNSQRSPEKDRDRGVGSVTTNSAGAMLSSPSNSNSATSSGSSSGNSSSNGSTNGNNPPPSMSVGAISGAESTTTTPKSVSDGGSNTPSAGKLTNLMNTMQKGTFVFNSKHTLRKVQKHKKGTTRHTLHKQLQSLLSAGNVEMYDIVKLSPGQDRNEWLAVHVVDFFNEVCLLFGAIMDLCTQEHCPAMTAGRCTYLWADGKSVKKPQKVPAHQYVDYLMTWIDEQISDDRLFESSQTAKDEISPEIKSIFKRLFRVYAHMYHKHFEQFLTLGAESHLNTCFERFIYFTLEFSLIEDKELEPLKDLIERFKAKRDSKIGD